MHCLVLSIICNGMFKHQQVCVNTRYVSVLYFYNNDERDLHPVGKLLVKLVNTFMILPMIGDS